jgi:hypothetical protein
MYSYTCNEEPQLTCGMYITWDVFREIYGIINYSSIQFSVRTATNVTVNISVKTKASHVIISKLQRT